MLPKAGKIGPLDRHETVFFLSSAADHSVHVEVPKELVFPSGEGGQTLPLNGEHLAAMKDAIREHYGVNSASNGFSVMVPHGKTPGVVAQHLEKILPAALKSIGHRGVFRVRNELA